MIQLDSNYRIVTDTNNYELQYSRQKEVTKIKDGIEETKTVTESWNAYYPTLQGALRKYLDEAVKPDIEDYKNVQSLLDKLDQINKTIFNVTNYVKYQIQ